MPRIKAMETRLPVADVGRSVAFFQQTLDFSVATLWPEQDPAFAILERDGCRVQLGKEDQAPKRVSAATLWLDVEGLAALHQQIASQTKIEWGPEVYHYGRREFGFKDPDGNWIILSEVTSDPPA